MLLQATQRVPSNVKSAAHTTTHAPEPAGRAKSETPLRAEGSTHCRLPVGRLEQIERLEQLRVIEAGRSIAVGITEDATIGVDTPEDAAKFEAHLGAS